MAENSFDWSSIDKLLAEKRFAEALALLSRCVDEPKEQRAMSLYALLAKVGLHGPPAYEAEIDALRGLAALSRREFEAVRRIFLCGFEAALRDGEEQKRWAYQRLLRRLLLGQPLNQPIPITAKISEPPERLLRRVALADSKPIRQGAGGRLRPVRLGGMKTAAVPLALGFWIACLLMLPMEYLVWRVVPASNLSLPERGSLAPAAPLPAADSETPGPEAVLAKKQDGAGAQEIKNGLVKQLTGLRRAYAHWSSKNRPMAGSVALKLTVDSQGRVVGVDDMQFRISEPRFIRVVMAEARKWRVPHRSTAPGELIVPLLFVPEGESVHALRPTNNFSRHADGRRNGEESAAPAKTAAAGHILAGAAAPPPTPAAREHAGTESAENTPVECVARQVVALHEEPRFGSSTIEEIKAGVRMTVMEVRGDWFKVRTAHSRAAGFVRKEFVVPFLYTR